MSNTCLVIGAGMAGLTAARVLQQNGWQTTVLDKGRGVGGRLATRRFDQGRADHGAQYFTVRTPEFRKLVSELEEAGVVKEWNFPNSDHPRFVGTEGMSAIAKFLAKGLNVRTNERVTKITPTTDGCTANTEADNQFTAAKVIITAPAPQAISLVADSAFVLTPSELTSIESIVYAPCFAVMVVLNQKIILPFGGLKFANGPVSWLADNYQKGISSQQTILTIHASPDFSRQYLEAPPEEIAVKLIKHLRDWIPAEAAVSFQTHRWRYSLAEKCFPAPFLATQKPFTLLFGGDGFGMGNVEGAFQSGLQMAYYLLNQ